MKTLIVLSLSLIALNVHAAGADAANYKGKVMLIQNGKHVSKCFPIGPKTLQMLSSEYDACADFKPENGALQKSFAKCDKTGSTAYVFNDDADCTASQSDLADAKTN